MKKKAILFMLVLLSILGFSLSLYLAKHHYGTAEGFCDADSILSCSSINRSSYSEVFHIPVAAFGVLWFMVLGSISIYSLKNILLLKTLLFWCILGLLGAGYLIFIEFVLRTLCLWCTLVHIFVVLSFLCTIFLYKKRFYSS